MRRFGDLWCIQVHDAPMWPIHGQYQCRTCFRRRPVPWTQTGAVRNQNEFPASNVEALPDVPGLRDFRVQVPSPSRYDLAKQL